MTVPSHEAVLAEIQRIAEAELDHDSRIASDHELMRDLGLDSLGAMVLAVGLEDRFRVHLDEQDAAALVTVGDLVALVQRRCAEAGHAART